MKTVRILLLSWVLLATQAAQAGVVELRVQARAPAASEAPLVPLYMEVWGSNLQYAIPYFDEVNGGGPFRPLYSHVGDLVGSYASSMPFARASIRYDTAAAPVFAGPEFAQFPAQSFLIEGLGSDLVTPGFSLNVPRVGARVTYPGRGKTFNVYPTDETFPLGRIPGAANAFVDGLRQTFVVDLKDLIGSGYSDGDFGLDPARPYTVRMTSPQEYFPVRASMFLYGRTDGTVGPLLLPSVVNLPEYDRYARLLVLYDGVFEVAADPADFDSADDFLHAQHYLEQRLDRINLEFGVAWDITSIDAVAVVPEPASWGFMLFGIAGIGAARRIRAQQT